MVKIVVIIMVLLLLLTGCTETVYQSGDTMPAIETLRIISHSGGVTSYDCAMVTGTARNVGTTNLTYAEIRVKWYDSTGTLLTTSLDNIADLAPGESWRFEVVYFGTERNVRYSIGIGTTW